MLSLGVDVHKRSCWVTVLDGDGQELEQRKLGMERATLLGYFGKLPQPAQVAVEATCNWYYFLNVLEPLGLELHLVHPQKTRAIARARIKHDQLDSRILARLLHAGFIAEAWIAPRPGQRRGAGLGTDPGHRTVHCPVAGGGDRRPAPLSHCQAAGVVPGLGAVTVCFRGTALDRRDHQAGIESAAVGVGAGGARGGPQSPVPGVLCAPAGTAWHRESRGGLGA